MKTKNKKIKSASLLQSSVSHDLSEIPICWFDIFQDSAWIESSKEQNLF